jgi:branched-chain amino acid transport system substrate-binding protein
VSELAAKLVRSIAVDNASRDNSGAGFSPSGGQREKIIRDRGGRGCRGSDSDLDVSGELCRDREDRHSVAAHGQCRSRRASLQSGGGSRRRHRQQQAMKKQGKKIASIAVVNENTDYGTSVADSIEAAAKKNNVPVAIRIPYSASTTDVSAQVLQLKEKQPDVVIFISYTSDSILYMKTMKNLDYMPPMVIGDDTGFSDPSFIPAVADIAQGAMNRSAWDIGKPGSTTYKINEMYKAKTGRDLDDTSARNMQSFLALADALNRAGLTEPEKIRDALAKTDLKPDQLMMGYNGVKFDETGQNILASTYLIQLKGKEYQLVWPDKAAAAKLDWPMKGWKQ